MWPIKTLLRDYTKKAVEDGGVFVDGKPTIGDSVGSCPVVVPVIRQD